MNKKLIFLLLFLFLVIGCRAKNDMHPEMETLVAEEVLTVDTPLFNPDTAGYLLQLPMGNPDILKKWKNSDHLCDIYDSYKINQTFCDSFLCGKTISYGSVFFKESYTEGVPMYFFPVLPAATFSQKMLVKNNYKLYFAYVGDRFQVKIFLFTVKENEMMDSKTIYYHRSGESGYTTGQLFYIDPELKISLREYRFTEEGIPQSPLTQWIINDAGQFVQYYTKDGLHNTQEERGKVKNHLREGNWIEKKENVRLYYLYQTVRLENQYTYLEAEYRAGVPVGEWRFYRLAFEEGKDPYSGGKGELVYTERYENGKMVKRSLVEGFKGDEIEYKKTEPSN